MHKTREAIDKQQSAMTSDYDKKLIETAEIIEKTEGCVAWYKLSQLAEKATSKAVKALLEDKSKRMYHNEEYFAGLI